MFSDTDGWWGRVHTPLRWIDAVWRFDRKVWGGSDGSTRTVNSFAEICSTVISVGWILFSSLCFLADFSWGKIHTPLRWIAAVWGFGRKVP